MSKAIKENLDLLHSSNIYLPTRTIFLTGEINEGTYEETIKNLHALDTEPETVTIYLNSGGGEVDAGFAIYSAIKAMKSLVRCVVWGQASSMASVILQGCDERILLPHSYVMIHEGSDATLNAPRDIQKQWAKFSDLQMKQVEDIYLEKIKSKRSFSRKRLQEMLKTDTILTAQEAVKLGLADMIKDVI